MMRFDGDIYRDGWHWLAEIPILEAMTQGRTKKEALEMIATTLTSPEAVVTAEQLWLWG